MIQLDRPIVTATQHTANRIVQLGTVTALLIGLRRCNPSAIANGVVSLAFAATPRYLERRFDVRLRAWQRLVVSATALLHAIGMLGPYDRIWWWDHLTHTLSAIVIAGTADVLLRTERERTSWVPTSARFRAVFIAGSTLGFGLLWELLERIVHTLSERIGFDPLLVKYSRLDTALDLVFDALGATLVILLGEQILPNVDNSSTSDASMP